MRKKIAIIGASYLQLPLVEKAIALDLEVHCFAWEEGAVCKEYVDFFYNISVLEKELILDKCREIDIDGIISIASDIVVPTISFIATELNLIANSINSANISTDKYLMRSHLNKKYCPLFTNNIEVAKKFNYPIIVKPTDRSGSIGVQKVNNLKELQDYSRIAEELSLKNDIIFEEIIEGKEYSIEAISYNGKHKVLAITEKQVTVNDQFVEVGHHQPAKLSKVVENNLKLLIENSLDRLEIRNGASHSEVMISKDGVIKIIEIGGRMGGDFIGSHLVQLSTGFDYLKAIIQISLNQFDYKQMNFEQIQCNSGVYFVYNEESFNSIKNCTDDSIVVKQVGEFSNSRGILASSDRQGYLIYKSVKERLELD